MNQIKQITEEAKQTYTVYTNDQQLHKIAVHITWFNGKEFEYFIPRLGGMHMLMSFIGCVGVLMTNTGLEEVMCKAFAGVKKMLTGKKFPQNMRALQLVAEECIRDVVTNRYEESNSVIEILEQRAKVSRTSKLWFDCLGKPVLIIVHAEREGDWPLHLYAASEMIPYFAAAAHWNYFRYGIVYLMKMSSMPNEVLDEFMKGHHVMRHVPGIFNGIWSDMMIETTVMRYGHGPGGVVGITLDEKSLDKWALSMHLFSLLEDQLLKLGDESIKKSWYHKEEGNGQIKSDGMDRENINIMLDKCINPFTVENHPEEIVNIVSGSLSSSTVNVDKALDIGNRQRHLFESRLPEKFYEPLSKSGITMNSLKKSVKVDDSEIVDTALIYSRVIAIQLSNASFNMKDVLKYELCPIPTSMFKDSGEMKIADNKSVLKKTISVLTSARTEQVPSVALVDGCAYLWNTQWPAKGTVDDFINNYVSRILKLLKDSDVYLVFDRYFNFSMKGMTRGERGK